MKATACRLRSVLLTAALAAGVASAVSAATLRLQPGEVAAQPGSTITLRLEASGVDGFGLGGFDAALHFDPAHLVFEGYLLSDALGNVLAGDVFESTTGTDSTVQLAAVSFLDLANLVQRQSDTFELATLSFRLGAVAPGTVAHVDFLSASLTDGTGWSLQADSPAGAVVRAVPEAASAWMLTAGLAGLGLWARLRRRPAAAAVG